jgi:ribosomal protein S2
MRDKIAVQEAENEMYSVAVVDTNADPTESPCGSS